MALPAPTVPALPERFTNVKLLGRGAQAVTVAAHDTELGRAVAIKVLDLGRITDWKAYDRFERECAVLESLRHPGVPAYLGHLRDEDRGQSLLMLELVEGRTLAEDLTAGRRRTEAELHTLFDHLLDVLEYLHGLHPPVIHRDIKPGNVIVRPDGRAVLVDFGGVTKAFRPKGGSTVVGTFGYMAPEQLYGGATPASDLYALAATLAALAAGEHAETLPRKGLDIDLSEVMAPSPLRSVLQAMLRADPDERLGSVAEVRDLLHPAIHGDGDGPLARREEQALASQQGDHAPGLPTLWRRLSPAQRVGSMAYVWVAVGLGVATRAVMLTLVLLLFFPLVLEAIYRIGRRG